MSQATEPRRPWLKIRIARDGAGLRLEVEGPREERFAGRPDWTAERLQSLAENLRQAALQEEPVASHREPLEALYRSLLHPPELQRLVGRLQEAARGEPLLLRFLIEKGELQSFPWEALWAPGKDLGLLGSSSEELPVRDVWLTDPHMKQELLLPREVGAAVRVLAMAPLHPEAPGRLKAVLHEGLSRGELEWLEPLGAGTHSAHLAHLMRSRPAPHIFHFIGHGGVDNHGRPALRMADVEGKEDWLPVELLAQELRDKFQGYLRLVILEACEGARPGTFASAAERLVEHGVGAVVAWLWPVKGDVARNCSAAFYRALCGQRETETGGRGDVARSLNQARRALLEDAELKQSLEVFSPVLYLRGEDSVLFDFRRRKVVPPKPSTLKPDADALALALEKLLGQEFSLVLGDRWEEEHPKLGQQFRMKLSKELALPLGSPPTPLPLSGIGQLHALHRNEKLLGKRFEGVFNKADVPFPGLQALAHRLGAGVHVSLLRQPVLERYLATLHPDDALHIVQTDWPEATQSERPDIGGVWVTTRRQGVWYDMERELPPDAELDFQREAVVLRLYSGFSPMEGYNRPLLTEDDYLLAVQELEALLPDPIASRLLWRLQGRPALVMGLSLLAWHHRILLYQLYGRRPLPAGSLVVLEPGSTERTLWEKGQSLLVSPEVHVIEATAAEFEKALQVATAEVVP